jgi:arylformamidase
VIGAVKMIDITQELFGCRVFPGDTPPGFECVKADGYRLTNMTLCVHNGTHVDAPRHFIDGGAGIDEIPLDVFCGDCTVADAGGEVGAEQMREYIAGSKERLLIKGSCLLTDDALELLSRSHIRLVGVESQTVSDPNAPKPGHLFLLERGVIPLEGLDLSEVAPGEYLLCAFPLKLGGADGSPVRAVLIQS